MNDFFVTVAADIGKDHGHLELKKGTKVFFSSGEMSRYQS